MSFFYPPRLLTADEYSRDLVKTIAKAKVDIALIATTFRADDPRSQAVIDALCDAADRGVQVSICVDTFTYLEPKEFWLRSPKRHPARAVQAMKLERRLKSHGISFYWLGRKANLLAAGRTHSKWVVIDTTVYTFGGVNMDNESFNNTDYMVKLRSQSLANVLMQELRHIRQIDRRGGAIRSHQFKLDAHNTVLFDGGLIGDSIIYRRACVLAREADHIVLVSQYCPTGRLNRILKRKHALLYYNHWKHASSLNKIMIRVGSLTAKSLTHYHQDNYLHAKFIVFTMPDGHKIALAGSHNFMFGSGLMGTREIALETSDVRLIKQLESFRDRHIASAE